MTGFLEERDREAREDDLKGIAASLDDYDAVYGGWQLSARISGVLRFWEEQAAEVVRYARKYNVPLV